MKPRLDQAGREAAVGQLTGDSRLQNLGPPMKTEMRRNISSWTGTKSCGPENSFHRVYASWQIRRLHRQGGYPEVTFSGPSSVADI